MIQQNLRGKSLTKVAFNQVVKPQAKLIPTLQNFSLTNTI